MDINQNISNNYLQNYRKTLPQPAFLPISPETKCLIWYTNIKPIASSAVLEIKDD